MELVPVSSFSRRDSHSFETLEIFALTTLRFKSVYTYYAKRITVGGLARQGRVGCVINTDALVVLFHLCHSAATLSPFFSLERVSSLARPVFN